MTIESEIYDRLNGFAGLTSLVSDRVRGGGVLKQEETLPAVGFTRVSAERSSAMGSDNGIVFARFQVDSWAKSYVKVRQVAEQVRQALQRFTGGVITDIFIVGEVDLYEKGTRIHHVATDFKVIYTE